MLCHSCHVRVRRDFPYCLSCGTLRKRAKVHAFAAPELQWDGGSVAIVRPETTIGRRDDNDVTIADPTVSGRHARIIRTATGFEVADLGSTNGTSVRHFGQPEQRVRGAAVPLRDGMTLWFGDLQATFIQPRPTAIGSKTQVRGIEHTMLAPSSTTTEEAPAATEPLSATPVRRSGWALKKVAGAGGQARWVLRNTRTGSYLSLDEQEVFIWEHLDGRNTMRDLLFAYHERFGELALPRIESVVRTFAQAGLVRGFGGEPPRLSWWRRLGRVVVRNLIRVQLSIGGLDPLLERAYRAWAWRLFTPLAVGLLWVLVIAGIYGFWRSIGKQELFDLAGAGPIGAVIVLAGYLIATAVHEAAHAFAVKSYGRRVNRGGFMLMLGMPFAFVDTSDMWFGTPYSRIVVAISGPLTTAGIAGGASLTAAYLDQPQVTGVCFTLAFGLYVNTLFNLIPLMPLDGYQALADALRTPRLREEAKQYFTRDLWRDIAARRRPGPKQVGLVIFAVTSMICLYAMVVLAVLLWNSRLGDLLRDHVDQPWRTVVVIAVIALLVFPIYYPLVRSLRSRLHKRHRTSPDPIPA
jgi:putative peptide zinc metalloprotease protein